MNITTSMFSFIYWVCAYAFETSILIKKVNIANPPPQFPHPFAVPSAMLPSALPHQPRRSQACFLSLQIIFDFLEFYRNRIIQNILFLCAYFQLDLIIVSLIHAVALIFYSFLLLTSVPIDICTTVCSSICLFINIWVIYGFEIV